MTKLTLWVVCIAALGGFLFGYNTSVIAGVTPFLKKDFDLTFYKEGYIVSILLIGALLGALVAGFLADRFGRRATTFLTAAVFVVGVSLAMTAESIEMLLIGRFITGIGVGFSSVVAPLYLAEISMPQFRGAVVAVYQLAIAIGILFAYLINYAFAAASDWRAMLGIGMAPAVIQLLSFGFFPESPSWLIGKGKGEKAFSLLKKLRKGEVSVDELKHKETKNEGWRIFLKPHARFILIVGTILSCFQQITGINTVIYYAPQIFEMAGYSSVSVSILASVGIGVINVLATLLAVWLMDRAGRRKLLLTGLVGMTVSLGVLASVFFIRSEVTALISLISLMSYVAFFAVSLGPVTWVVVSEIYPLKMRGRAMSIAICANWAFNYLVSLSFLDLVALFSPGGTFCLYAFIGVAGWWFVHRYIPETKGRSLEEIERIFK